MNPCVKTGFNFRDIDTGEIRTGDLFYHGTPPDGMFQIRGIPIPQQDPQTEVDAWVRNVIYTQREGGVWLDTNSNVSLINPSWAFQEHIKEYYPELIAVLTGAQNDG